jgi:molybdenum cofactor cytidylyltransferase
MIWAIILAAGESKRMHEPKLLLPYGERSIIETVIARAVSSKVDRTLLVLGAHQGKILQKTKGQPVQIVVNEDFVSGMLSSVQKGFNSLPEGTRAALVLLGDQPSISSAIIDKIIEGYKQSRKGIVLPTFNQERGHPVLIDLKYREEINRLSPDVGLRGVVYSHPDDVFEVPIGTSSVLQDIDTPQDYKKELAKGGLDNP